MERIYKKGEDERVILVFKDNSVQEEPIPEELKFGKETLRFQECKPIDGCDVVKNIERYDTLQLIEVLKQITDKRISDPKYSEVLQKTNDFFWKYFYAYYFCQTCDDMVICDLFALPTETAGTIEKKLLDDLKGHKGKEERTRIFQEYLENRTNRKRLLSMQVAGIQDTIDDDDLNGLDKTHKLITLYGDCYESEYESWTRKKGDEDLQTLVQRFVDSHADDIVESIRECLIEGDINGAATHYFLLKDHFGETINDINTFLNERKNIKENPPRLYVIFKGLDAVLEPNFFMNELFGNKRGEAIARCSPKIYLFILLAIYKHFFNDVENVAEHFNAFLSNIYNNNVNGLLHDGDLAHLTKVNKELKPIEEINKLLDRILKPETDFVVPRDIISGGVNDHIGRRIGAINHELKNIGDRFAPVDKTGIIRRHIYFTAFPIDSIRKTIHRNNNVLPQAFDGLDVKNRLPLGTMNFVDDLLNANGCFKDDGWTDMEHYLYKYKG